MINGATFTQRASTQSFSNGTLPSGCETFLSPSSLVSKSLTIVQKHHPDDGVKMFFHFLYAEIISRNQSFMVSLFVSL